MAKETIFYSSRIHDHLLSTRNNPLFNRIYASCLEMKERLISLLNKEGFSTHEILRPEIYKHDLALRFLTDFKEGSIHLIFKPFENLRLLKQAYNISVVSWNFDTVHRVSQNNVPFTNHRRMLSLVDEIWVFSSKEKSVLNEHQFLNVFLISEYQSSKDIPPDKIRERIRTIGGKIDG